MKKLFFFFYLMWYLFRASMTSMIRACLTTLGSVKSRFLLFDLRKKKRHLCLFKKGHGIHSFHHKICQHSATCRNIFVCIKRTWNKVANTTLEEKFLTPFRNTYLRCWKIFLDSIMLPMMGIKLPKLDFYKQSNWSYDVLELESNPSQISSTLKTTKKCEKIFLKG